MDFMKRSDFTSLLQPLTEKLYQMAYALVPDDLQAEQLVIDSVNAFLVRERRAILNRPFSAAEKKEVTEVRRAYYKGVLRSMSEIGVRRAVQMAEQLRSETPVEFKKFYDLDPRIRFILKLRFEAQLTVEEIQDVIEKLHNGRFLLTNQDKLGMEL
jgi:hypothetical protein